MLQLPAILHSISAPSLANHLATFRRDLLLYFVDHVLNQPYTLSVDPQQKKKSNFRSYPRLRITEDLGSRLNNVSTILGFLDKHIFPHLPSDEIHPTEAFVEQTYHNKRPKQCFDACTSVIVRAPASIFESPEARRPVRGRRCCPPVRV